MLYPGQSTPVTYAYTPRGHLDTVTDWLSNVTDYDYDAAGRLIEIAYPNGVVGTLGYNNANQLTDIAYDDGGTPLETISYALNAAGMRTQMTDSNGTTLWDYDALYRLTSVDYPTGDDVGYAYDAVGNRETLTVGAVTTDYTYNTLNQLTAIDETDDGTDDITFGYDANGNQTSRVQGGTTTAYAWDSLNRLTSVTSGGSPVASYDYNGDGLRTSKTVGGNTTRYTWDPAGLGTVIQESSGDAYVWGLGLIGQIDSSSIATFAHSDGLGSIRLISDATGAVVGETEYDAFGAVRATTGVSYPFGYTGEQVDPETGFVYLRARYMDPATGRFLSKDPIGIAGGINLYAYVCANPINLVDLSGSMPMSKELSDGIIAHQAIEAAFMAHAGSSGWQAEAVLTGGNYTVIPDLYNPTSKTYYEIKPHNDDGAKAFLRKVSRYSKCGLGITVEESKFPSLGVITTLDGRRLIAFQGRYSGLVVYRWLGESTRHGATNPLSQFDPGVDMMYVLFGLGAGGAALGLSFGVGVGGVGMGGGPGQFAPS